MFLQPLNPSPILPDHPHHMQQSPGSPAPEKRYWLFEPLVVIPLKPERESHSVWNLQHSHRIISQLRLPRDRWKSVRGYNFATGSAQSGIRQARFNGVVVRFMREDLRCHTPTRAEKSRLVQCELTSIRSRKIGPDIPDVCRHAAVELPQHLIARRHERAQYLRVCARVFA
jgi:hypothetical protein